MSEQADTEKNTHDSGTRRPGRPKKPAEERRDKSVGVRLNANEKSELKRRAEAVDLSMSEYLRRQALGGEPIRRDATMKRTRQLSKIGRNLRRLVQKIEEGKIRKVDGIEEVIKKLQEKIEDI